MLFVCRIRKSYNLDLKLVNRHCKLQASLHLHHSRGLGGISESSRFLSNNRNSRGSEKEEIERTIACHSVHLYDFVRRK